MYEKIVIIGSPGAGKTTLAQMLGDILNIQVFHLDHYFWLPGWKEKPIEERITIQQTLIQEEERWIIEGTYLSSSDVRLNAADTIILLDTPMWLCMWHSIKRRIEYRDKQRDDLAEGCHEKLQIRYILKVLAFPFKGRNLFFAKLSNLQNRDGDHPEKVNYVQLRSKREIADFLCKLPAKLQKEHAYAEQICEEASLPVDAELVLARA